MILSGSFWRESKSVLARGYATAAQATMAFAPTFDDLCTNAKQSFQNHTSFYSTLPLSPSLSPNLHPDDHLSNKGYSTNLMTDSICESTIGRELNVARHVFVLLRCALLLLPLTLHCCLTVVCIREHPHR